MKRYHFYSAVLVIVVFSTINCYKREEIITEYIPTELKEYSIFEKGSYWLYKNENDGNIDSTYIFSGPIFNYYQMSETDYTATEQCQIFYDGSFIGSTFITPDEYKLYINGHSYVGIKPESLLPGKIFTLESKTTLTNINLLDSITIYNHTFHNVFVTQWQRIYSQTDTFRYTSYFVKKVGLVKFTCRMHNVDTTWTLVNCHAIH